MALGLLLLLGRSLGLWRSGVGYAVKPMIYDNLDNDDACSDPRPIRAWVTTFQSLQVDSETASAEMMTLFCD